MPDTDPSEADRLNAISQRIIGGAIAVHKELGAGMLESAYRSCLAFQLHDEGLMVEREVPVPLIYRSRRLDCGFRIDLLVEKHVVVEVKAIERIDRVHRAQVKSYLRMTNLKLGLLINFNVPWLQDGIKRVVNEFPE